MPYRFFLCFMLCVPCKLWAAGAVEYPVSEITDSLKRNAGAVVRFDNVTLTIHDIHKYLYEEEKVISILNSSKDDLGVVGLGYDEQLENIKSFKAWLYDADGKMVKHLDKQDGQDYSALPGFVLAGTYRAKYWDLRKLKPPYTIKYIYEKECRGTFQLPAWKPAPSTGISIEHAAFNLNTEGEMPVNYITTALADNNPDKHKLNWKADGFCALKANDYAPDLSTLLPTVLLMAKEFEVYGYKGTSETWNDIGLFMNTLMKGREDLGTDNDPRLTEIISSDASKKEKVRLIYKYLQSNFRYVCITLGIGGWQPQDASFTMQKKYGDCKALSMVMKAMLKKAGIESCITLITAGDDGVVDLQPAFPHSYFNHAILCVPLPDDTIWLECTSQVLPFNYLGHFTSNRRALMIFDGGARVVHTPIYAEKDNISHTRAHITLNTDNAVSINASISKAGELQDNLRQTIDLKDTKNIETALYDAAHLKNSSIKHYEVSKVEPDMPVISYTLSLTDEGTIRKTESRLFIKTDLFSPVSSVPEKNDVRTQKLHVRRGYSQSDTLIYSLPTGYAPESFKPDEEKQFTDTFGYATCKVKFEQQTGELILIRTYCVKHAVYTAAGYQPFREFLLKAMKQCCPELVLKKQE